MALPLLTVAAVPFTFGANQTQHQSSIAARRQIRRLNTSTGCQTGAGPFENLDADKRAIIAVIVSEAAKEIQSVMDLGNRNGSELENFPTQPPNTPNNQLTFDFPTIPRLNRTDGLQPRRNIVAELTSEEEEKAEIVRPKRTRSFRKRRRVPSFKTGQQPRVPAKVGCSSSSSEADDESSEPETLTKSRTEISKSETPDCDSEKELELKLNLLSETRRTFGKDDVEEWARVGTELRNIADTFQKGLDSDDDEAGTVDIFSLINLMLPFSVPQSLWSALFSYAAWKIFKRFQ